MTEWRIIPSAPFYAASDDGRIKRAIPGRGTWAGRILRSSHNAYGYLQVSVHCGGGDQKQKSRRISRLVCEAFHGAPPSAEHEAAHNDGNPENNLPSNLRWATHLENMQDTLIHGTATSGEGHPHAKLNERAVLAIRARLSKREGTLRSLAAEFGVSCSTIYRASTGQNWRAA